MLFSNKKTIFQQNKAKNYIKKEKVIYLRGYTTLECRVFGSFAHGTPLNSVRI